MAAGRASTDAFLIGALIAAGGNLWLLILKYKGVFKVKSEKG